MNKWPKAVEYKLLEDGQTLEFEYIRHAASGRFACVAQNRKGVTQSYYMDISVLGKPHYMYIFLSNSKPQVLVLIFILE